MRCLKCVGGKGKHCPAQVFSLGRRRKWKSGKWWQDDYRRECTLSEHKDAHQYLYFIRGEVVFRCSLQSVSLTWGDKYYLERSKFVCHLHKVKVDTEIAKISPKAGAYCGTIEAQTLIPEEPHVSLELSPISLWSLCKRRPVKKM